MTHLEETLEVVLSRGENLVLDSKMVSTSNSSYQMFLLIFWFLLLSSGSSFTPLVPLQFPELLSALLLAEQKVGCSLRWRLHEKLLQRYSCLARLLPGEMLHQSFSPRIFIILTTNVRPCDTTGHHQVTQVSEPGSQLTSSPSTPFLSDCRRSCRSRRRPPGPSACSCATTGSRSSGGR